jgi:hypothetical protein
MSSVPSAVMIRRAGELSERMMTGQPPGESRGQGQSPGRAEGLYHQPRRLSGRHPGHRRVRDQLLPLEATAHL